METVLMIVTIVALALALGMSVVAWRLLRDHRSRASARVEALQAMADANAEDAIGSAVPGFRGSGVPQNADTELGNFDFRRHEPKNLGTSEPRNPGTVEIGFAATISAPAAPRRRWVALAVVGVLMAGLASAVYAIYRPIIAAGSDAEASSPAPPAKRNGPRPLELLSLRHSVDADGAFAVTGLIQNPADGMVARKVVAVVYLFDREGHYFASGKAALELTVLQPGEESPFVVRVPNPSRVSRYRVTFRSEEGGVVPHIDRRGELPGGTTGDAIESRTPATKPQGSIG